MGKSNAPWLRSSIIQDPEQRNMRRGPMGKGTRVPPNDKQIGNVADDTLGDAIEGDETTHITRTSIDVKGTTKFRSGLVNFKD